MASEDADTRDGARDGGGEDGGGGGRGESGGREGGSVEVADIGTPVTLDDADDATGGLDVCGGIDGDGRSLRRESRLLDIVVLGYGCTRIRSSGKRDKG